MQARYYDPVIGLFYSNDPLGFRDVHSFNRYAYANNNPYKYVDPDGKAPGTAFNDLVNDRERIRSSGGDVDAFNAGVQDALDTALSAVDTASDVIAPVKRLVKQGIKQTIKQALKRSCCFVAGTQVLTEDGYKNIEDVELGEKLWSKNVETGEQDWKAITKIFVEPDRGIYEISLISEDGFDQKIEATNDHPFYVTNKGWKQTLELVSGDMIETDGNGLMKVVSVVDEKRIDLTYNFTVADFHTYYVTEKNVLVHNCGNKRKGASKNESHGDGGRAATKAEEQLEGYNKQLEGATKKEAKKIKQKIQNITKNIQRKAKGENHSMKKKG